jgi:hypothetical protein
MEIKVFKNPLFSSIPKGVVARRMHTKHCVRTQDEGGRGRKTMANFM